MNAVTASRGSRTRGAIQVARGVADESTDGTASVGCAFETVEHALSPRVVPVGQLVHRADVMGSGIVSGAVEIAGLVKGEPAPRTRAIAAGEGMDHGSPSRLH